MQRLLIVIPDVVLFHALTGQVVYFQQPFVFEAAKEAFDHGIIPARTAPTHGGLNRMPLQ